jgi:hypothetical protein
MRQVRDKLNQPGLTRDAVRQVEPEIRAAIDYLKIKGSPYALLGENALKLAKSYPQTRPQDAGLLSRVFEIYENLKRESE